MRFFSILCLIAIVWTRPVFGESAYELISDEDGVKIWATLDHDGNAGVKAEAVLPFALAKIAAVLANEKIAPRWVPMVVERRLLARPNANERIDYTRMSLPAPLDERYLVTRTVVEQDADGTWRARMRSVSDAKTYVDEPERVLGDMTRSDITLTPVDAGRTSIRIEFRAHPKGRVPDWIVRRVQAQWPRRFLGGLTEELGR